MRLWHAQLQEPHIVRNENYHLALPEGRVYDAPLTIAAKITTKNLVNNTF